MTSDRREEAGRFFLFGEREVVMGFLFEKLEVYQLASQVAQEVREMMKSEVRGSARLEGSASQSSRIHTSEHRRRSGQVSPG